MQNSKSSGLFFLSLLLIYGQVLGRVCPDDTPACIDDMSYTFYICPFLKEEGECTEDVSQSFMTGTFVREEGEFDGVFTDGELSFNFTENCYDFEMPTVGLVGTLSMDNSVDPPDCFGIYGTYYVGGLEYGQFVGEYIAPTPMPTPTPTAAPTSDTSSSTSEDVCDFEEIAFNMDCPDLTKCHRGNWTFNFCDYECEAGGQTTCKSSLAEERMTDLFLNWGDGILIDDEYYEYEFDCRKFSVPEYGIEAYFMEDEEEDDYCDIMSNGVWSGGLFSAVKTDDLPSDSDDKSMNNLEIIIAVAGALGLAVVGIMVYMLFNKWKGENRNKAVATNVFELPATNNTTDAPPPYIPYNHPGYDPFAFTQNNPATSNPAPTYSNALEVPPSQVSMEQPPAQPPQAHFPTDPTVAHSQN